jgi:DNA-binding protein YbaB
LQQAISEAVSRVQAVAAEKMKAIAGNLNIPGM